MQLFYNPDITKSTTQIIFDKIESKHIEQQMHTIGMNKTMRNKPFVLAFFDGW